MGLNVRWPGGGEFLHVAIFVHDFRVFGLQYVELPPQHTYLSLVFLADSEAFLPACNLFAEPPIFSA
jgi:hypothetical protein